MRHRPVCVSAGQSRHLVEWQHDRTAGAGNSERLPEERRRKVEDEKEETPQRPHTVYRVSNDSKNSISFAFSPSYFQLETPKHVSKGEAIMTAPFAQANF